MSEIVKVYRGTVGEDEDGNPVQGDLALWKRFRANVAPSHPGEPVEVGRQALITGYTIYVRCHTPTGILATDVVEVRGVKCPVDGIVGEWRNSHGQHKGDQFAVKVVNG